MCYRAQFCSSSLKNVVIDKGEPPNWGALGHPPLRDRTVADPRKSPLPISVTKSNLVVLRQRVYA